MTATEATVVGGAGSNGHADGELHNGNGHGPIGKLGPFIPDYSTRRTGFIPDLMLAKSEDDPKLRGAKRLSFLLEIGGADRVLGMFATAGGEVQKKKFVNVLGEEEETSAQVVSFKADKSEISVNGLLGNILIAKGKHNKYNSTLLKDPAVLRRYSEEEGTHFYIISPIVVEKTSGGEEKDGKITIARIGKDGISVKTIPAMGSGKQYEYTREIANALGKEVKVIAPVQPSVNSGEFLPEMTTPDQRVGTDLIEEVGQLFARMAKNAGPLNEASRVIDRGIKVLPQVEQDASAAAKIRRSARGQETLTRRRIEVFLTEDLANPKRYEEFLEVARHAIETRAIYERAEQDVLEAEQVLRDKKTTRSVRRAEHASRIARLANDSMLEAESVAAEIGLDSPGMQKLAVKEISRTIRARDHKIRDEKLYDATHEALAAIETAMERAGGVLFELS